ncbi:MAG: HAD family phosphatase [Bryobacteraceae bacterium]
MRISPSVVIFDYGNVLCQSQPASDAEAMAAILDVPLPRFTELYWQFRIEYDAAALAPAAYWNIVAQTASRTLTADQTSELIEIDSRSWSHPAPVMPQWARDIRAAGLRTAILSNMPAPVRDYVLRCPWLPEFDARVFSCDLGVCKPEAEMYRECLLALAVHPSEVLFLDDREANVRAAEALGLHAILFTDAFSAAQQIDRRFSLPVTLSNLS